MTGFGTQTKLRRDFGRRFSHRVSKIGGMKGLHEAKHFEGRSAEEEAAWVHAKAMLRANPNGFTAPVAELRPGTDFESLDLPDTFLVSLDGQASGFGTDAAEFFGAGGPANPSGLLKRLDGKIDSTGGHTGLLLERTIQLGPKESHTVRFLYGYLPEGFALDAMIAKYERTADSVLQDSSRMWKQKGMRFDVPAEPWVKREATWNHYYLRSSQTYDDFFGEHILNQNGFYQYTMGFQGAARDPLQHCLPFLFSDPEIVRSVLRYTLKEVRDDGSLPYGIVGHGVIAPMASDNASDLPLWLLWTTSEYVLATRDVNFLNE
jgi:cellobiose phosphorylase